MPHSADKTEPSHSSAHEFGALLEAHHTKLLSEIGNVRRVQEKHGLMLARVETKLDEREKSFEHLRVRVITLECNERKNLYTLGKLAGLGGLIGAAAVKVLSKLF